MDCKRALEETGGDLDKAVALLRERGLAAAAKKAGREAREGLVASYIHTGGRIGVLIEVNCETDFVARTDEFQKLVRDLAMQVAGLRARVRRRSSRSRPTSLAAQARRAARRRAGAEEARGHPRARSSTGQLRSGTSRSCLYEQPFRDTDQTVGELITDAIATIGENIRVRRFTRYAARGGAVSEAPAGVTAAPAALGRPGGLRYRRILLKLSGEALLGDRQYGVDPAFCAFIARQVARGRRRRRRGRRSWSAAATSSAAWPRRPRGMDRATGDYIGMLATVMNGLALQDALEKAGVPDAGHDAPSA